MYLRTLNTNEKQFLLFDLKSRWPLPCSELMHRGEVRNNETVRGYYNLSKASFNFVVPDVKSLFRGDDMIPREIKPTSCIKESHDLIDKSKEHVLIYDCKKVVRGFKGRTVGDVYLWDFEGEH